MMDSVRVNASLETRTSKKGSPYQVLVIKLTDSYEKLVFLDKAEIELLRNQNVRLDFPNLD